MLKKIIYKLLRKKIGFSKKFFKFDDALKVCDGYNDNNLIDRIYKQSIKAIKNNKYEQDGIIYDNPIINEFIVDYLCNDYIINKKYSFKKKIKILDYGGSFGNLYYSLKNFIHMNFEWEVIEQKRKVTYAKKNSLFKEIRFSSQIDSKKKYDIIIFNTSFQYLPNPIQIFKKLRNKSNIFIFTNLILNDDKYNYLKIENPDPKVYKFTYPCWFLSKFFLKEKEFNNLKVIKKKILNPPYALSDNENYYNILLERKN